MSTLTSTATIREDQVPDDATPEVPHIATAPAVTQAPEVSSASTPVGPGLVDYRRTARRLRTGALLIALTVLAAWGVLAALGAAPARALVELAGLGLVVMLVVEIVVVGSAAVRGMLAAGDRGERLAAGDVALVPPQLRRLGRR